MMGTCPDNVRDISRDFLAVIFTMHSECKGTGMAYFCREAMQDDILFVRNRLRLWEDSKDPVELQLKQIAQTILERFEKMYDSYQALDETVLVGSVTLVGEKTNQASPLDTQ